MELDRESWDRFVQSNHGSFLQSWQWGLFQQSVGRKTLRFVVTDETVLPLDIYQIPNTKYQIRGLIQFIEMPLPFGLKHWYGGRGPTTKLKSKNEKVKIIEWLKGIPTLPEVVFLRLDPTWPPETGASFLEHGWRVAADIQPRRNWVLDIASPDEELLAAMHPKTRYNIRIAAEKCAVRKGDGRVDDFEGFWELVAKTATRHRIRSHPKKYYQAMLAMPIAELWQAEHGGEIIASHIVIFFGKRATYLHGASSYEYRALMAPHLLHWAVAQEAKRRGCVEYDFGGIDEARWPGLTRFKKGFGGNEEKFVGTFDLALKPFWYKLYQAVKRLR